MYYFAELFVILTFFILPPIFSTTPSAGFIQFTFYQILIYGFLGIYCLIRGKNLVTENTFYSQENTKKISTKHLFALSIIILVFLFLNGYLWKIIARLNQEKIQLQKSVFYQLFQIFGIFVYAFYEEAMYRYFVPTSIGKNLSIISKSENPPKWIFALSEIIALLLFSFGHLYMGIFAVLNGFFAGIALRFLVWKTKSVFPSTIIHFIYNLVLYLSMFTKA